MKTKIIEFATEEKYLKIPQPAKEYVPEWYKKTEKFYGGKRKLNTDLLGRKTVKNCIPFLDSFITGYMIELCQDLHVEKIDENYSKINWDTSPNVLEQRLTEINNTIPIPDGYTNQHFAWNVIYNYKTTPGYSLLITHPFNRWDLPFYTLTGIVDTDNVIGPGNLPFFLSKEFEGIIPVGTPIAQILPFKRENWKALENKNIIDTGRRNRFNSAKTIGWYKKNFWHKKNYN